MGEGRRREGDVSGVRGTEGNGRRITDEGKAKKKRYAPPNMDTALKGRLKSPVAGFPRMYSATGFAS